MKTKNLCVLGLILFFAIAGIYENLSFKPAKFYKEQG